jgi:hypothetical protein
VSETYGASFTQATNIIRSFETPRRGCNTSPTFSSFSSQPMTSDHELSSCSSSASRASFWSFGHKSAPHVLDTTTTPCWRSEWRTPAPTNAPVGRSVRPCYQGITLWTSGSALPLRNPFCKPDY